MANRVQQIRENSTPDQWKYIETKENPADESSRGLPPQDLVNNSRWLSRPSFLRERELPYRNEEVNLDISQDDSEVKKYKFSPLKLTQKGWQPSPNAWSTSSIGTEPRELCCMHETHSLTSTQFQRTLTWREEVRQRETNTNLRITVSR